MSQHYTPQRNGQPSGTRPKTGKPQGAGPKSFRCDIGGEWKPLDGFSKKFQRMAEKPNFNPAKSGMICRVHSGEPVLEAKCNGPCGRTLPLNSFSKSSRTKGVIYCIQCQSWVSTQHAENGSTPYAPPYHELDADEQQCEIGLPMMPEAYAVIDSDDEDDMDGELLAPVTGMGYGSFRWEGPSETSSFKGVTASVVTPSVSTAPRETVNHAAPPHLQSSQPRGEVTNACSQSSYGVPVDWVPPHLRARSTSTAATDTPAQTSGKPHATDSDSNIEKASNTRQQFVMGVKAGDNEKSLMAFSESGPSTSPRPTQPPQNYPADQSSVQSANEYYKLKGRQNVTTQLVQSAQKARPQKAGAPPHRISPCSTVGLQPLRSDNVSTATTVRQERANQAIYNAWDSTGARHARPVPPPSTTTGDGISLFRAVTTQKLPTPNTGGFARGYSAETARKRRNAADEEVLSNFGNMDISGSKKTYNFDIDGADDEDAM